MNVELQGTSTLVPGLRGCAGKARERLGISGITGISPQAAIADISTGLGLLLCVY